jgi:hypothetical protein
MDIVFTLAGIWIGAFALAIAFEVITRPHGGPK